MAKSFTSERRIKALLEVVLGEMRSNPAFALKVGAVFDPQLSDHAKGASGVGEPRPRSTEGSAKRGNRRAASFVDPLTAIQSGQQHLRDQLESLDLEQLRDVIADYRMDPNKLAMKWKDRKRIIDHIVITAVERGQKGDAFRA